MTNSSEYLHALFGLDDQVAVVIGGTGVLGGGLCDGIAQAGAKVIVAGRSPERGEQRVASIRQAGGQAAFLISPMPFSIILKPRSNVAERVLSFHAQPSYSV